MIGMRMCTCKLIGEFYFDGLNPKSTNKKHLTFHLLSISSDKINGTAIYCLKSCPQFNC